MELKLNQLAEAPQSLSPSGDRTISVRDARVSAIANLGATKDGYDCIDLSNNEITKLDNIPFLPRLKTLIVANNRISKIYSDIHQSLPNLTSLVLTGNNIKKLLELVPLFMFKKLERLSLLDNPVIAVPYFKEYVTCKEREASDALFRSQEGISLLKENGYFPPSFDSNKGDNNEILEKMENTTDVQSLLKLDKQLMESQSDIISDM